MHFILALAAVRVLLGNCRAVTQCACGYPKLSYGNYAVSH